MFLAGILKHALKYEQQTFNHFNNALKHLKVHKRKMCNPKVKVIFGRHSQDFKPRDSISDNKTLSQRGRIKPKYIGVDCTKTRQLEHQKIGINKRKPDISS